MNSSDLRQKFGSSILLTWFRPALFVELGEPNIHEHLISLTYTLLIIDRLSL